MAPSLLFPYLTRHGITNVLNLSQRLSIHTFSISGFHIINWKNIWIPCVCAAVPTGQWVSVESSATNPLKASAHAPQKGLNRHHDSFRHACMWNANDGLGQLVVQGIIRKFPCTCHVETTRLPCIWGTPQLSCTCHVENTRHFGYGITRRSCTCHVDTH